MTTVAESISTANSTDASLLEATSHGDHQALTELFNRYIDFVYAIALRQTGNRHLSEDITQAVFILLTKKAATIQARSLAGWLHQTARYAAANANRQVRRRIKRERAAARSEIIMPPTPSDRDARLPLLDAAIASLSSKDRTAVINRYLRARPVGEVARTLGTTPGGAQKRLERSLDKLRRYFAAHPQNSQPNHSLDMQSITAMFANPQPPAHQPP